MIFFKIMKSLKVLPQKTVIRGFFNKSPDVMLNKPPPPASQEEAHVEGGGRAPSPPSYAAGLLG